MSTLPKLDRILATEVTGGIELAVEAEGGHTLKVLATPEQIARLIKELGSVQALAAAAAAE